MVSVSYCCVHGCPNKAKRNLQANLSFHKFPSDPDLKRKWLKAIGRPDWKPPSYKKICSAHFDTNDIIVREGNKIQIADDAYPVNALPPKQDFEAADVEVCRFCLATDVKMYSLEDENLKMCLESVVILNGENNIEGLPQYICYECKTNLWKCYNLIQRCLISQSTLLDIYAEYGEITKPLVKKQNRQHLNLISPISHNTIPSHLFEYTYDDCLCISNLNEIVILGDKKQQIKDKMYNNDKNHMDTIETQANEDFQFDNEENEMNHETIRTNVESDDMKEEDYYTEILEEVLSDSEPDNDTSRTELMDDSQIQTDKDDHSIVPVDENCKTVEKKNLSEMSKYFKIVKLSLQDQYKEYEKKITKRSKQSVDVEYTCDICRKKFITLAACQKHVILWHDPNRGSKVCPICKKRFKTQRRISGHILANHSKKYYCKFCPKIFTQACVAQTHMGRHKGKKFACTLCPFKANFDCVLRRHFLRSHPAQTGVCTQCGHGFMNKRGLMTHIVTSHPVTGKESLEPSKVYPCEQCGIDFISESAREVHLRTSVVHKNEKPRKRAVGGPRSTTCLYCGEHFPTFAEKYAHVLQMHPRTGPRDKDIFPKQCDYCEETFDSRRAHWLHVLRAHPGMKRSYRPYVAAVCAVCGKGFWNTYLLRQHELRHASPTVPCGDCGKLFHDDAAVKRHAAAMHLGERKYACNICSRKFARQSTLYTHTAMHLEPKIECPICKKKMRYKWNLQQHIRTVHMGEPHQSRKPRTRTKNPVNEQ